MAVNEPAGDVCYHCGTHLEGEALANYRRLEDSLQLLRVQNDITGSYTFLFGRAPKEGATYSERDHTGKVTSRVFRGVFWVDATSGEVCR